MNAMPIAIDYLNPVVPRALPWHELELVEATPESLAGYGVLVVDPQDFPVEIVTWPKPHGRPVDPGTGNEAGTVSGEFSFWWEGDLLFGANSAVDDRYLFGRLDQEAGIEWCNRYCDSEIGDTILELFVSGWAAFEGQKALEYTAQRPASAARDKAMFLVSDVWIRRDPESAHVYMQQIGPDQIPDWLQPAILPYADLLSRSRFEEALVWARAQTDPVRRRSSQINAIRRWREVDEPAAMAWMEASDLTEDEKKAASTYPPKYQKVAEQSIYILKES